MDKRFLILGIGNMLWADEGFGVRCVEHLAANYRFPDNVTLLDGGTQGIYLVHYVQDADVLVVFDAIDYGLEPGTIKLIRDDEVPKFMGAKKMSLHQTGFQEVLSMSEFTGHYPEELLLVGIQPQLLEDFGGSLTDPVRAKMPEAMQLALDYLAERGVQAEPLEDDQQQTIPESAYSGELSLSMYEGGRPDEIDACRTGDPRFIPASAYSPEDNA
ncbi:MAG: HyaD/HybD family hydrogenase maturation endopeptidase [Oceanobacter sp.]